jgi:hypothetical protein
LIARERESERARRSVKGVCDVRRFYNTTKQTIVDKFRHTQQGEKMTNKERQQTELVLGCERDDQTTSTTPVVVGTSTNTAATPSNNNSNDDVSVCESVRVDGDEVYNNNKQQQQQSTTT